MPDVVDEIFGRRSFEVALIDDEDTCCWTFEGDRRDLSMVAQRIIVNGRMIEAPQSLRYLFPNCRS